MIIADLHIHGKYSRATSHSLDINNLEKYARIKGVDLLSTGDFQHPKWIEHIKENLKDDGTGILKTKTGFPFILQTEISLVYSQDGKGRRVHLVVLAPNLEVVNQITEYLKKKGRIDYDGRPIFNISCIKFVEDLINISKDIEIIPAHCLLPNELIHTNYSIKKIKEIKEGYLVYTHNNNWERVKKVIKRNYSGKIYKIQPWYFSRGLSTTPEHPFYAIKSYKSCSWTKGLCKKGCSKEKNCKNKYFLNYKKEWIQAKDLEMGDFLIYPRFNTEKEVKKIDLTKFVKEFKIIDTNFIIPKNSRNNRNRIKKIVDIDKDFCRLIGYFLSEGYVIGDEAIGFSFNSNEQEYINEVISFMKNCFNIKNFKIDSRYNKQADIIFYSHVLNEFFKIFYKGNRKRAPDKYIPHWILLLSKSKIAEILRGWWRGDTGCTCSRKLANDMKIICLKLGIIPSIHLTIAEIFNKSNHLIGNRKIISKNDTIYFSNLSFFEEDYRMLKEKCFRRSINKIKRKHGWIDKNNVYIPIRDIKIEKYTGDVYNLEVDNDNSYVSEFACIHNCMTPWFGIFGSMSGFNSLKEAFGDKLDKIHAVESGMSADPKMLWQFSFLNDKTIVSFSDLHSFWPWRIGREATIFNKISSYNDLINDIRNNNIFGTIEVDAAYGKYHFDGHRACNFSCSPEETRKLNKICPICRKPLTIGVEYRVEELTNQGIKEHKNQKPYYKILPLHELISCDLGVGLSSKTVWKEYYKLINEFKNEFNILLNANLEDLKKITKEKIAELIIKNREGKLKVKPGYDGKYGVLSLDGEKQISLTDS